jgi:hypothetical protein
MMGDCPEMDWPCVEQVGGEMEKYPSRASLPARALPLKSPLLLLGTKVQRAGFA